MHGTFPEGNQNKFFVLDFQKLHCWAERKSVFLPMGPQQCWFVDGWSLILFPCASFLFSFFPFPMGTRVQTHPPTNRTRCEERWHVPFLPVLLVRAVRWGVEYVLYLGVDTPDGVSESCSSPSTIFGIPSVRHCLALSSSAGPGLNAILYLKQPEAYVSLIFAKANLSFLYDCSRWQIQVGCSAQGVRRSFGFPCLCLCASAELCVCEISAGWMVKLEAQRGDKKQCKWIQKGFGSFS